MRAQGNAALGRYRSRMIASGLPPASPARSPVAYKWRNHVVLEFHRTPLGDKNQFISVTINGVKSYFNRTYYTRKAGVRTRSTSLTRWT